MGRKWIRLATDGADCDSAVRRRGRCGQEAESLHTSQSQLPGNSRSSPANPRQKEAEKREEGIMKRVGDIRQIAGNQNSAEIDGLARFAVDEQNKKQNDLLELRKVVNVKQQVVSGTIRCKSSSSSAMLLLRLVLSFGVRRGICVGLLCSKQG
ncbi:hypothetical protein NL676_031331 [Syzygium grande]|nr:hypothetical protein NL676_031331 [Syzygium grande]